MSETDIIHFIISRNTERRDRNQGQRTNFTASPAPTHHGAEHRDQRRQGDNRDDHARPLATGCI
jgi:hypothetical protein